MIGKRKKDREKIKELEERVSKLESNMYISVYSPDWPGWSRPKVDLHKAIRLILDHLGLELAHFEESERFELRKSE